MNNRVSFRLSEEMRKELDSISKQLLEKGLDLDESKIIRYLISKGIEKVKEEGVL